MSSNKKVRVGSRKSELALIQTKYVISALSNIFPEKEFEIVTMSTLGDKVLDIPLPKIGEKSLFTKELETALATGCVDFVVHSLKDLPTVLPEGMAIGAVLQREDPRDALVICNGSEVTNLQELQPGSVIGTSSLRRTAQLARNYPHLKVESIRGNLNTRMRKLDELGVFSAIILAQAGLSRMSWQERITRILKCDEMLYAVGQGALAVECRENDTQILNILHNLHCPETVLRVVAERSFLKTLGGGCSAPVAVSTNLIPFEDKLRLELTGAVWSLDGQVELRNCDKCTVEVKPVVNEKKSAEAVCPLGYTRETVEVNNSQTANTSNVDGSCPQKHIKLDNSSHEVSPCKKIKLDDDNLKPEKNLLLLDDPHKHCPVTLPVGLDFMGKCPYLDSEKCPMNFDNVPGQKLTKCPVNAEIQNVMGEHTSEKVAKCPFMKDGKLTILSGEDTRSKPSVEIKSMPAVCPYRQPKLYCGIVPSKRTPLWALEQAEHLGINSAETLLKNGALEVMKAAQVQIRGSS